MVRHQAVGPDLGLRARCGGRQQVKIEVIVARLEERLLPPIATLGHMVRDAGDHDAGEAGYRGRYSGLGVK